MAAPTIPYTIPGTVDQERPELVCRLSFDAASTPDPLTWVDVSNRLRSFEINRGGEKELELVDTGSAFVVLDNRDRALDPFNTSSVYSPNVRPMRRLWIQSQWDGDTIDQFYGWTGSFKPVWPTVGTDAVVELTALDGFKIVAGEALPTTSPPRDSYADVVLFDEPTGYWKLNEAADTEGNEFADSSENSFTGIWSAARPTPGQTGMIVGESDTSSRFVLSGPPRTAILLPQGSTATEDVCGNFAGKKFVSVEAWVRFTSVPAASQGIMFGPPATGTGPTFGNMYGIGAQATGELYAYLHPQTGGVITAVNTADVVAGTIYHVVMTYSSDANLLSLYVNGALVDTTAGPGVGVKLAAYDTGSAGRAYIGWNGSNTPNADIQHVALYPTCLSAARVAAHYEAGASMGHNQALTDARIDATLTESGVSFAPRRLRVGQRQIQPDYFTGEPPKEWIENAIAAEGDPSLFFFAKDGAAVFLDRDYRTVSPWSTVQATFDDDGTDLPYADLEIDDGEAFIRNDIRITREGGELQQRTDPTSIGEYQRTDLTRDTLNVSDADAADEADALLAKYKDPIARVIGLELSGLEPLVLNQILEREIGDRIRIIRRPVGGGSAIDEDLFIRKITLSGSADDPFFSATWSVTGR